MSSLVPSGPEFCYVRLHAGCIGISAKQREARNRRTPAHSPLILFPLLVIEIPGDRHPSRILIWPRVYWCLFLILTVLEISCSFRIYERRV